MTEEKLALIIPAAGSGKRLGADLPKPFLKINGKTILQHTLEKFTDVNGLTEVIISTSESFLEESSNILSDLYPEVSTKVIQGGNERQDSIRNAINALSDRVGFVAVHDAVRPFVEPDQINTCFLRAQRHGAAILAVPAKDTIKMTDDTGFIVNTPDRSALWLAQTPQIFEVNLLKKAYKNASEKGISGTDDSYLVEQVDGKVFLVKGSAKNFKITFPLDLEFAKQILKK